jgi:hypothetical protein
MIIPRITVAVVAFFVTIKLVIYINSTLVVMDPYPVVIVTTGNITAAPTFTPTRSPTFYDYVIRLFVLNTQIDGSAIRSRAHSSMLCSDKHPHSTALINFKTSQLHSLSPRPNTSVVYGDTIVAHDWEGFLDNIGMIFHSESYWLGDAHSNCNDWTSLNGFGMLQNAVEDKCLTTHTILCFTLIRL